MQALRIWMRPAYWPLPSAMMTQNPSVIFTDLLASQTPGVLWPALPAVWYSTVLALLFQKESSQCLPEEAAKKWSSVPLLTCYDVQSHAEISLSQAIPTAHGTTFDSTTGSTGGPVTVRRNQLTLLFWEAAMLLGHLWHRRNLSGTMAIIRHFDRPVETSRPRRWSNGTFQSGPAWHLHVSTKVDRQLPWLRPVNPDVVLTYPPYLSPPMARMRRDQSLSRLCEVRTISGTVSAYPRQVVETDMYNCAMPLIRYPLPDWAGLSVRALPTLRIVKGKKHNMAYSPDGKPYWPALGRSQFRQIIPSFRQYQQVETKRDAITVKLACGRFFSAEQFQSQHDTLTEVLGYTYRLELRMHSTELPLSVSGKFEEFMSLLPESGQIDEAR